MRWNRIAKGMKHLISNFPSAGNPITKDGVGNLTGNASSGNVWLYDERIAPYLPYQRNGQSDSSNHISC
jgi:hypothetical protein